MFKYLLKTGNYYQFKAKLNSALTVHHNFPKKNYGEKSRPQEKKGYKTLDFNKL